MAFPSDFPESKKLDVGYILNRLLEAEKCERRLQFAQDGIGIEFFKKGWFSTSRYVIVIENIEDPRTGKGYEIDGIKTAGMTLLEGQMQTKVMVTADKLIPALQGIPEAFLHIMAIWNPKPEYPDDIY